MKVVATNRGLIPRDQLQVSVEMIETDNALVIATVWRLIAEGPDAPHVKRDASVIVLAPLDVQAQAAALGSVPTKVDGADLVIGLIGQQMGTEQAKLG